MKNFEQLIEAESFEDYGGWTLESQFIEEMGSSYLLAHGIGTPCTDASTTVAIPEEGEYRLWVRTKDWEKTSHVGRFQVRINGKAVDHVFGENGKDWSWELAEHVHFPKGNVKIALHDLTGFEGRCDALYITNTTIAPVNYPLQAMRAWRKRVMHLPMEPKHGGSYDVIVVGGGIAGCCAAYTAAVSGSKVLLLHDSLYLGGNASHDVGLTPEGEIGGLVDLLSERQEDGDIAAYGILTSLDMCEVKLGEVVQAVTTCGNRIASVKTLHIQTNEETEYSAQQFVDCSGKAVLGMLSGASTMFGEESKSDFGESLAPIYADDMHHGNTLFFRTELQEDTVDFPNVPWAQAVAKDYSDLGGQIRKVSSRYGKGPYENQTGPYVGLPKPEPVRREDGSWIHPMSLPKSHFWEYGQWLDPYEKGEEIRDHLYCAIVGTYANVRQKDPAKYSGLKLVHLTNVMATGAYRSYLGDYILTENDIRNHTNFEDAVAVNSGAFCLHYPGNPNYDFRLGNWNWVERDFKPYTVPFRCLYSRDIENLLFAGKHISATHIASSTIKLIGNGGHQGEAVGIAASLCVQKAMNPRELNAEYIGELKEKIDNFRNTVDK